MVLCAQFTSRPDPRAFFVSFVSFGLDNMNVDELGAIRSAHAFLKYIID